MKPREWYRAEIRWAVMEDKRGLRFWEDAVYFFLSEDRDAAFQHALEIGWRERDGREEGRRRVPQICRCSPESYVPYLPADIMQLSCLLWLWGFCFRIWQVLPDRSCWAMALLPRLWTVAYR
jgi:hypothetical protein